MDAVGLEHALIGGDAFQQEGKQDGVFLPGDIGEHRLEPFRIGPSVVGRKLHAGNDDTGTCLARHRRHLAQVGFGLGGLETAQPVVAAQFYDYDLRLVLLEQSRQSRQPSDGRLSADAGVDNLVWRGLLGQPLLQKRHPALAAFQTILGRQAVAQYQNAVCPGTWLD